MTERILAEWLHQCSIEKVKVPKNYKPKTITGRDYMQDYTELGGLGIVVREYKKFKGGQSTK